MSELSDEVKGQIADVSAALIETTEFVKKFAEFNYDDIPTENPPIDVARYNLTLLFALNSLFWMFKRSYGEDPQIHGIKGEMDRIKEQMLRLKQVQSKPLRPRVNTSAATRIVKHELGPNARRGRKRPRTVEEENWDNEMNEIEQS